MPLIAQGIQDTNDSILAPINRARRVKLSLFNKHCGRSTHFKYCVVIDRCRQDLLRYSFHAETRFHSRHPGPHFHQLFEEDAQSDGIALKDKKVLR